MEDTIELLDTVNTVNTVNTKLKNTLEKVKSTMDSSNLVNVSIITYVSFTFLFFVLKYRFFPENNYYWILLFLMISCLGQLIQNINITASPQVCGSTDIKMAFYATFIPWILIFTLFTLLLITTPGWLRVFSNTFGVFAAEAYGIQGFIQAVMVKPNSSTNDYPFLKMIESIYSDRMSLVIELNIDDVTDIKNDFKFPALDKLEELKLIAPMPSEPLEAEKITNARRNLYKALLLKDNVGYFFWFLLIGILCILVSTNTILSSSCSPKVAKSYASIFNS
jgi:hypothetical protein